MCYQYDKKYKTGLPSNLSIQSARCLIFIATVFLTACVKHQYVAEPVNTLQNQTEILVRDHRSDQFKTFLEQHGYSTNEWPITRWDLSLLTFAAVYFNPAIQVARSEIAIQHAGEIIADQRPNPTVAVPLEHYDDASDSPWLIGLVMDILFERPEKGVAAMEQAIANRNAAEIKFQQQVWTVYSDLHKNLVEYFAATRQKELLLTQQELLKENIELLSRRKELGQVSQFELSRIRLELQHNYLQLSDQNYVINNAFHNLIAVTGLQVDKFDANNVIFDSIEKGLVNNKINEQQLRKELLNNRFDVNIKLKEYDALEAELKLEIIKQYPDINLSPGFIFDQGTNVWALGASWVLPLFHNHEGEIQQALAKRSQMQAEFMVLQTSLVNELNRKYQNYIDKLASYENSLLLLEELEERISQVQKQFDLGYSDQLTLIQVKLELEKARQAIFAIKVDVLRAVEQLERTIQQPMNNADFIKTFSRNIYQEDNKL